MAPSAAEAISPTQLEQFLTTNRIASTATAAPSAEDEEVRKVSEMIRNSPDLINALIKGSDTPVAIRGSKRKHRRGGTSARQWRECQRNRQRWTPGLQTPLRLAARSGNKAMIELLLAKGADVNSGRTGTDTGKNAAVFMPSERGFKTAAEVTDRPQGKRQCAPRPLRVWMDAIA